MESLATSGRDPSGLSLVVVGASAGGIDALMTMVASLPENFSAPIVIAQHIDRSRPSHLAEVLASRSRLSVRTVTSRERLEPGTIFVVPADRDVEIDDHHVSSSDETVGLSRPSVDRLLATAARVFGPNLIAVILTGTGSDGAAGATAVKAYGGAVVVQNPATAEFPGMPASVPPMTIDIVAEIEAIGPLLVDLLSGEYTLPESDADDELPVFLERIRDLSGLDFGAYKQPTIVRRLQRRMAAVGTARLVDYRRYLDRHPDELQHLVASFLIKVTEFFRDPELFTELRDHIMPKLIDAARERGELRIWSAGCATGEEAYSLAMLVADLLQHDDPDKTLSVRIFATDVAVDAVAFARRGLYPASALTGLPPDLIERHFVQLDGVFEVRKSVRSLVVFGDHDLGHRAPFPRIDLVLCRNVLIYFTPELQRRALQLFAFSLRQGSYLVLGKAESVSPLPQHFALEDPKLKVFRRVGEPVPLPTDQILDVIPLGRSRAERRHDGHRLGAGTPQLPQSGLVFRQASRWLDDLQIGIVIVDRRYDIRSINVAARRLLGIRHASLGEDLIHRVAPALTADLRAAIDTALVGEPAATQSRVPDDIVDGGRDLAITCTPIGVADSLEIPEAVLIEVVEVTSLAQRQRELEGERNRATAASDELRAQMAAAVTEVRELRQANQAMAGAQGRLLAENEQLQVATEEAQASTEEIETLNEELQASNEELETLNEELQAAVEELTSTNDELQARSAEVHELVGSLDEQRQASEADRDRLETILANLGDAVLVLDASGAVVLANAAYQKLIGTADFVPENELGQPIPLAERPQQRAIRGETSVLQFMLTAADGTRRWLEAKFQPVSETNQEPLFVIVFRDITERSLRRLQEEFLAVASHELRTPLTTLSGSLQLLKRRLGRTDQFEQFSDLVERALEQSRRLQDHIAELMDVARLQGGRMSIKREPADLNAVVNHVVGMTSFLDGHQTIRVDLPDEPIVYYGDAQRLEQVLLNLITNAMSHAADSEFIDLRLRREPDAVVLEVQDYGPGVPADKLPFLFLRFFQAESNSSSQTGLGLGLYIAKEIAVAHSGDIVVRSVLGEGTTFTVRLPVEAMETTG